MADYLDFEKPIIELQEKIDELSSLNESKDVNLDGEIKKLQKRLNQMTREIFSNLNPWEKVELARHPKRPYTMDYVNLLFEDWVELHGDRKFADDRAIVTGMGKLKDVSFIIVGQEKGRNVKEKVKRNFGSPHPEGYRKALRVMKMGGKFNLPIISFIDTSGAYPGIGAEERGQAMAIAENIKKIAAIEVPIIIVITGEGGSGGALAIGVGDRIFMQKFAIYSVISPEGCAAILWRDRKFKKEAAASLKLSAEDLKELEVIDAIIREPERGAHSDPKKAAEFVEEAIMNAYNELKDIPPSELVDRRIEKFSKMGVFREK